MKLCQMKCVEMNEDRPIFQTVNIISNVHEMELVTEVFDVTCEWVKPEIKVHF